VFRAAGAAAAAATSLPLLGTSSAAAETSADGPIDSTLRLYRTVRGTEYGMLGLWPEGVSRVLLTSTNIVDLKTPYYTQAAVYLRRLGYMVVAIDVPSHGSQIIDPVNDVGLDGWAWRVRNGMNFVEEYNKRLHDVVTTLIAEGRTRPGMLAVQGTSRGGFLAYSYAMYDDRVACASGFSPITDLVATRWFAPLADNPLVQQLNLTNRVSEMLGNPVFLVIGDRDGVVSNRAAVAWCQSLSDASVAAQVPRQIVVHQLSEPIGHTVPSGGQLLGAAWVLKVMQGMNYQQAFATASVSGMTW
jgi:pimeloyl-ACP methyl ester carboxylesterase